jgi:hypothetical protein
MLGVAGVGLVLLLAGGGASAQDTKDPPPVKVRGQLPQNWKKLGLSTDQTQKIYAIRGTYQGKISTLATEIRKLKDEERRELFKVLTEDQKTRLRKLAEESVTEPAAKDKEKTPEVKKQ